MGIPGYICQVVMLLLRLGRSGRFSRRSANRNYLDNMFNKSLATGISALVLASTAALAQTDNFSGGDSAWTHYSPLTSFGAGGTFTADSSGYHITAPASPAPAQLGPSRVGAFRTDFTYSDFTVSADITAWNPADNNAIGLVARIGNPGLGTTTGYLFAMFPSSGVIALNRLDNENAVALSGSLAPINVGVGYRLVFSGVAGNLTGSLYSLSNLTTPIATATASDTHYSSGFAGVFSSGSIPSGVGSAVDVTFANYSAAPEPSTWALLGLGTIGLVVAAGKRRHQ